MGPEALLHQQRLSFLDAACHRLGFCLPSLVKEALVERSELTPKGFVKAVIEAEGIKPVHLESYEHFKPLMALYRDHILET